MTLMRTEESLVVTCFLLIIDYELRSTVTTLSLELKSEFNAILKVKERSYEKKISYKLYCSRT
jgi:hypothetical protein